MPDGRFLSKKIAHDMELNTGVSLEADYLFTRCIPHLDKEGRMWGHPAQVKAIAVPLRDAITSEVVDRCLGELAYAGMVTWYVVGGRPCLAFQAFDKNQKGLRKDREADSEVPSPQHPDAQQLTTVLRINSGPTPAKVGVSEVKLSQGKLSTVDKSTEADASEIEQSEDDNIGAVFAPLIREHCWLGNDPPDWTAKHDGGHPWHMGRELSIARQKIDKGEVTAAELARIIEHHRDALDVPEGQPTSLLMFNLKDNQARLSICKGYVQRLPGMKNAATVVREMRLAS